MQYRYGLVVLLFVGCQESSVRSGQQGAGGMAADAGVGSDPGSGSDAGQGGDCGGACGSDAGMGSGTHAIAFGVPHAYAGGHGGMNITAADLNGDGALDLVESCVANTGSLTEVHVLRGSGTGAFADVTTIATAAPTETVVSDFNGDGVQDIAGVATDGMGGEPDFYLQGQGNLNYTLSTWGDGRDFSYFLADGDFNEDGTQDLLAAYKDDASQTGGFVILKMPGFTVLQDESDLGHDAWQAVAGDFDGDGHQDVVVTTYLTYAAHLYRGNGSGTVTPSGDVTLSGVSRIKAVDLDHEGRSDLMAIGSGIASVSYGTASGLAPAQAVQGVSAYAAWIAAGDFNGDGRVDLAILNTPPTGATVDVWRNTPSGFTHAATLDVGGEGWALTAGDFNGDAMADLAVPGFSAVTIYLAKP